ncbi:MAG TPA: hypothetical protein VLF91_01600 [Candidatus Saccharimonadales bacterium]|nr:hypothetical protein [Candidatus Saccharimonadales bacterium]
MSEQSTGPNCEAPLLWEAELINYNRGYPEDAAERDQLIHDDLLPTNNLHLYFLYDPTEYPGEWDPFDYNWRPFGPVMQAFRDQQPELWQEATAAAHEDLHPTRLSQQEASDEKRRVFTRVIRTLAPMLQDAGFSAIDVCK